MGAHLARDEANGQHIPTWLAEQTLESGHWPKGEPTTAVERVLLWNLIRTRREAEAAQAQVDAIEGTTHQRET